MNNLRPLRFSEFSVPLFVVAGLVVAGLMSLTGNMSLATRVLSVVLFIGFLPFVRDMLISLRRGHFGVDIIAVVGITASLLIQEYLAGCVILLMLSGGAALESYARRRARKELTQLLSRAPTLAHRKHGKEIVEVSVGEIIIGDVVVVKPGEILPVDGVVIHGTSMVDESALTGESLPVDKGAHSKVMSGSVNLEGVLEVRTLRSSKDSKYAQIVRLVSEAEKRKAPFVRLADRYSVFFTLVAFGLAALAWLISRDPVRALAVLVVATPCPLILATPIAFTSGMARAAMRGIIIKSGEAIEKLAEARSFLFDKTGTITLGTPKVIRVVAIARIKESEVERLSASLDQLSAHVLADSLVHSAREAGITLEYPQQFSEHLGYGVEGQLGGKKYVFGKLSFLEEREVEIPVAVKRDREELRGKGIIPVYLARGSKLLGVIFFADQVRDDVRSQFEMLSRFVPKIVMITGDREQVAKTIASQVGIADVRAQRLPEQKMDDVRQLQQNFGPVAMVGDGINDAPALAAADVGIVLGSSGTTAAHEAGDIVIAVNQFDRILEVFRISRHVLFVAKQGIFIGISLSIVLMAFAALGYIRPVIGALLQELIDVLVIFNALRVHEGFSSGALPNHAGRQ